MTEGSGTGGWERPAGAAPDPADPPPGTGWLPPIPPGPPPGTPPPSAPAGWRVSPKAIDLDPDSPPGPEPWADPGNSVAGVALGLSVAGFGLLFVAPVLAIFSVAIAIAGTVLSAIGRRRIKRGETRQGRVEVAVGLAVGIGTLVIAVLATIAYLATN